MVSKHGETMDRTEAKTLVKSKLDEIKTHQAQQAEYTQKIKKMLNSVNQHTPRASFLSMQKQITVFENNIKKLNKKIAELHEEIEAIMKNPDSRQ